jgi:drug/metabolite transporter (DMT)-like permease
MIRAAILLAVLIVSVTAGDLAITHGMKQVGGPARLRPRDILAFLWRALRSGWFWTGLPLMTVSFCALLVLLSWEPISFVIPASALTYVSGTLGAKYLLREEVSPIRWAGVLLVCAGVALVTLG